MNKVILIGRTVKKPELRVNEMGHKRVTFTLAVNRDFKNPNGQYDTDFIDCIAFNNADNIAQYVDKGSLIAVSGRIQKNSYTNQNGEKRYITNIVADRVEFLSKAKTSNETEEPTVKEEKDVFADFGQQIELDDNFLDD